MRERFDSDYIRAELKQIGGEVETPLQVFLIGGGAMAFRDLKDATKDIDLIVTGGDGLRQLQTGLQERGYEIVRQPGEEYDALGAQRILENEDGCRIDLFNQQVIDKLVLSQGMRDRSEEFLSAGGLPVNLVSVEDIFLFKAVAGRTDDIEDMFVLYQTDLDFDVIEAELQYQIELLGQELFVTSSTRHCWCLRSDIILRHPLLTPSPKSRNGSTKKSKCYTLSKTLLLSPSSRRISILRLKRSRP